MGEGQRAIEATALPQLVLQPEDLGGDFARFDEGPLGRADFHPGPREEADRFGRIDGWKARYRRSDPAEREGVLVVQSLVDVFEGTDGAEEDLAAYEQQFERDRASDTAINVAGRIGDETAALVFEANGVFFCTVAWRFENVTASVLTQAFDRDTALEGAVDLAGKQQRRIAAAAGD
jgi:hypothetical protein